MLKALSLSDLLNFALQGRLLAPACFQPRLRALGLQDTIWWPFVGVQADPLGTDYRQSVAGDMSNHGLGDELVVI